MLITLSEKIKITETELTKLKNLSTDNITGLNPMDGALIILDVDAEDRFWKKIKPETFANTILEKNLPTTIHTVYFITSEVNKDHNLLEFATKLIEILKEKNVLLTAYVPTDFNNTITFIVPPQKNKASLWQIYGINTRPKTLNFDNLNKIKNKTLIWEGENILKWLENEQKKITATPILPERISFRL
ncbi:MAG: hypothetical protein LEGION0398_MBIBDBAK_00014 [Legionellaceae bacterium]